MQHAKLGDTVQVHYRGTLDDGTVFDSSENRDPLHFTIGSGQIISGFEEAVIGMTPGEHKTERIPAEQAYGPHRDDLVFEVDRSEMASKEDIQPGDWLQVVFPDSRSASVQVREITESAVKVDANHPLAGMDLVFDLELVAIE
jgi:peptidylprolyl isomerase